jgi:3-oxoacyl-(acyl-carrier-protein) synthase
MSRIRVRGLGAVSPAGWGVAALREALRKDEPLPVAALSRPGWEKPLCVRPVPSPAERPAFLSHPRLRRAGALTLQAVAAALEALGEDAACVRDGSVRLRIVVCLMPGCVTYSRRFYEEVLQNPATASPLIFPETVFNAPASHLAAYLNTGDVAYTLVGDNASFLQGLALAAGWLLEGQADGCLVVAAEEMDWMVADAVRLFARRTVQAAGAGALYLRAEGPGATGAELGCVTDAFGFSSTARRAAAARGMRAQLPPFHPAELLCLGTLGERSADADELAAWRDWPNSRLAPKRVFGEAFTAAAAWQCVAACDALQCGQFPAANVSVVGVNQQAIGARFMSVG